MDSYDVVKMQNVVYVMSQIASAQIELEAMKSENQLAERHDHSPAWGYNEFISLIDKYQLGHNSVITNLHKEG
jgi:hypothetical protein